MSSIPASARSPFPHLFLAGTQVQPYPLATAPKDPSCLSSQGSQPRPGQEASSHRDPGVRGPWWGSGPVVDKAWQPWSSSRGAGSSVSLGEQLRTTEG